MIIHGHWCRRLFLSLVVLACLPNATFASGNTERRDLACTAANATGGEQVLYSELPGKIKELFNVGVANVTLCITLFRDGCTVDRRTIAEAVLSPVPDQPPNGSLAFAFVYVFEEVNPIVGSWRISDESPPIAMIPIPDGLNTVFRIVEYIAGSILRTVPTALEYRVLV